MSPFYTPPPHPRKQQNTSGFLTFLGGEEREHWPQMGLKEKIRNNGKKNWVYFEN